MMPWIKIQHSLPRKPEVMQLAAIMGIDEMAVVGHLVCFWSWVDLNLSLDCPVARGTESGLDRVAGRDGFVRAMVEVGWLNPHPEGGYLVPDYDGHLSKSAKQRALDWKKKQRHRSLSRNCPPECPDERGTNEGQKQAAIEKEEEKETNNKQARKRAVCDVCFPASLEGYPGFMEAWEEWVQYRKEKKSALTPTTIKRQLKQLEEWGPEKAIAAISNAMTQGYTGLFEAKNQPTLPGMAKEPRSHVGYMPDTSKMNAEELADWNRIKILPHGWEHYTSERMMK